MEKVVVLGAGESGTGAALLAKQMGFKVFVSDFGKIASHFETELNEAAIDFESGKHTEALIMDADWVVKSPGIPEKVSIIQKIREKQIPVISEIEFAARFSEAPIIAITGSNGKTTTTALIGHVLKTGGLSVAVGGNIGKSFARICREKVDYFVLEVSSFQLDDVAVFKPFISVLLNITPDHLERYDSFESYASAKANIYRQQTASDVLIYNESDTTIQKMLENDRPEVTPIAVSEDAELLNTITVGKWQVDITKSVLKGIHNQFNIKCAMRVAQTLNLSVEICEHALQTFKRIPHRLETVDTLEGVTYINDSKATNVEATKFALKAMTQPVIWIVGGLDKGNNYDDIQTLVKNTVKACVFLGVDNQKLIKAFDYLPFEEAKSMAEAVSIAKRQASAGDVVLLSPACASFDLFKNYEDRGDQFRNLIQES